MCTVRISHRASFGSGTRKRSVFVQDMTKPFFDRHVTCATIVCAAKASRDGEMSCAFFTAAEPPVPIRYYALHVGKVYFGMFFL